MGTKQKYTTRPSATWLLLTMEWGNSEDGRRPVWVVMLVDECRPLNVGVEDLNDVTEGTFEPCMAISSSHR